MNVEERNAHRYTLASIHPLHSDHKFMRTHTCGGQLTIFSVNETPGLSAWPFMRAPGPGVRLVWLSWRLVKSNQPDRL